MEHFDSYDVSREKDSEMSNIYKHVPKGAPPNLPMEVTDEVVRYYSDMVYRIALTKTQSSHDADDIFQEVFLKLVMNSVLRMYWFMRFQLRTGTALKMKWMHL